VITSHGQDGPRRLQAVTPDFPVSVPSEAADTPEDRSPSPVGSAPAPSDALPSDGIANGMDDYIRLQWRLMLATALVSALAVLLTAWLKDLPTAGSVLVGALAGLLYLRLLARSVSRLGGDRRSVGKLQLLVPAVLVVASARIPALQILPALLGFLLYKPALILQAVFDA
jgi:ATP synthase protein I